MGKKNMTEIIHPLRIFHLASIGLWIDVVVSDVYIKVLLPQA
jgi:hypothetical protein